MNWLLISPHSLIYSHCGGLKACVCNIHICKCLFSIDMILLPADQFMWYELVTGTGGFRGSWLALRDCVRTISYAIECNVENGTQLQSGYSGADSLCGWPQCTSTCWDHSCASILSSLNMSICFRNMFVLCNWFALVRRGFSNWVWMIFVSIAASLFHACIWHAGERACTEGLLCRPHLSSHHPISV